MTSISREQVDRMLEQADATLVEVLPPSEFRDFHLPGAVNVPLGPDFERRIEQAVGNKHDNVIVYCRDSACPASGDAASRMERLGYDRVYRYAAGKADWKAAGMPVEG